VQRVKKDPYAALRIKEFNIFLIIRFVLIFGWSMQFIIIEWQVYSITKNPLSLGMIGLMEVIPAVSMALFAGHIVDQKEKRNLFALCIGLFSIISLGLFLLTWPTIVSDWSTKTVLYSIYGLVFLIRKKPILNPKIGEPIFQSLKEGIQFVYKTKAIFGAITLDMVSVLFGGAVALLPIYAQDILKVGPQGFGALRAAPAIGAFLTMFITAYIPISKNAGKKLLFAIFGFGVCIIVFGLSTIFWVSLLALFFSGVTDGISMVIRQTILQLKTPDHMRGRVSSVNSMFVGSSNELGAFESGFTAKLMGTVTAVVFGGTMTLITVITTGIVSPSFRALDLRKDLEEHEKEESLI